MSTPDSLASRELFIASFAQGRSTKLLARSIPQLVRAMKDVRRRQGEALFNVGDASNAVYFIASGRVDLLKNNARTSYGERSVVGTSDALLERARTQDAIAVTDVHVLELPVTSWLGILEDNVDAARSAMAGMAANVDSLHLKTAPSEEDDEPSDAPILVTMPLVDRIVTLRRAGAFRHARIQSLASLAAAGDVLHLAQGEKLFGAEAPRHAHYVVGHGCIEANRIEPSRRDRFGAGELVLGAASFVERATFEASAMRESVVLRIAEEDFIDVSEDHFDLVRAIFTWLEEQRDVLI